MEELNEIRKAYCAHAQRLGAIHAVQQDPELVALLHRVATGSLSLDTLERATKRDLEALASAEVDALRSL